MNVSPPPDWVVLGMRATVGIAPLFAVGFTALLAFDAIGHSRYLRAPRPRLYRKVLAWL